MHQRRWLGVLLILLGVFIILSNVGVLDLGLWQLFATYWPLLLIGAGLYNLLTNPAGRFGGLIILLLGSLFLAGNLDQLNVFEYVSFWPLVLIFIGVWLLLRGHRKPREIDRSRLNLINIFSGTSSRVVSSNFKGGSSISIFGGAEIDLREAVLDGGRAQFDVFALFGGDDIYVPEGWNVVIKGLPIFAGWDDNTRNLSADDAEIESTLEINCLLLFGGVDVNN